jgi:hypothetical protein
VLVLSQHVEAHYALRLITQRPDGAGYLLKERVVDVAEFIDSAWRVANGGLVVDTEVVSELLTRARGKRPLERLTARERDVLMLIAEGKIQPGNRRAARAHRKDGRFAFFKLDLPSTSHDHRRVLAVLTYLRGSRPTA